MVFNHSAADRAAFPDIAKQAASKLLRRYRRDGLREASRYYAISAKHLVHFLAYDRWMDRLEARPTGGSYKARADEVVGPVDTEAALFYQAFPRLPLYWSIATLGIDPRAFSFVDYGSGRGRQLLAAARLPFRRVVGVEFAASLHEAAVENIENYAGDHIAAGEVVTHNRNALDFELPAGNLVIFIFNSFKGSTLERVADRIAQAVRQEPDRQIFLIYGNSDRLDVFERRPAFRRIAPPARLRLKLGMLGTVPIDLFRVQAPKSPDRAHFADELGAWSKATPVALGLLEACLRVDYLLV